MSILVGRPELIVYSLVPHLVEILAAVAVAPNRWPLASLHNGNVSISCAWVFLDSTHSEVHDGVPDICQIVHLSRAWDNAKRASVSYMAITMRRCLRTLSIPGSRR